MIVHENHLPADDSHEICLIRYFWKSRKSLSYRLLQNIGAALRVKSSTYLTVIRPPSRSNWTKWGRKGSNCFPSAVHTRFSKETYSNLLNLYSWCLLMVEWLCLAVPRGCLRFVIVVFPDHTHLLFVIFQGSRV